MRWTAQYLLKMHNYAGIETGAPRPAKWRDEDKLIMMVRSRFDCVVAAGFLLTVVFLCCVHDAAHSLAVKQTLPVCGLCYRLRAVWVCESIATLTLFISFNQMRRAGRQVPRGL